MIKKLSPQLLFCFLRARHLFGNKSGEMVISGGKRIFGVDKDERYAAQLSMLNLLKEKYNVNDKEYENIKCFLKTKYKIA